MATQSPPAAPCAPALPDAIRLSTYYAGFDDEGAYYVFNAGDLVTDPAMVAYFVNRGDAIYEVVGA
jgi:hypothetical protein